MKLIRNEPTSSAVEAKTNKLGWWSARLVIEQNEKPFEGWTGFVYSDKQEAIERILRYAAKFRPNVEIVL